MTPVEFDCWISMPYNIVLWARENSGFSFWEAKAACIKFDMKVEDASTVYFTILTTRLKCKSWLPDNPWSMFLCSYTVTRLVNKIHAIPQWILFLNHVPCPMPHHLCEILSKPPKEEITQWLNLHLNFLLFILF